MKKRTQRIVIIVIVIALLVVILVPALTIMTGAVTQEDIDDIKDQISENSAQIKEIEEKLEQKKKEEASANEQIELLEEKIALLNEQISNTEVAIQEYNGRIEEKQAEIEEMEELEAQQYALFCAQTRDMEETGEVSYLSILFSASSFSELLDYAMLISEVMEYHNSVINDLLDTESQLDTAKTELEQQELELETLKAEQEGNKAELLSQEAEVENLVAQIQSQERSYQSELDIYEKASAELDKQLEEAEKQYEEELAALAAADAAAADGDWYWPLPGRYYISSTFAYRIHPITGVWSHHTGNDIPAPSGTEIHAANSGIVTDVGYNSTYGNYIQISHGNGYTTFYGHMKSTAIVSVGSTVEKGQVIGYVGTTGQSTGNHLHFELKINGVRADALDLYPNLTFTYSY